jgi:hypothetical protein
MIEKQKLIEEKARIHAECGELQLKIKEKK